MLGPMQVKCRVYRDHAGEWRWTWTGANGEKVANSGEGYGSYAAAWHAASRVAGASVTMPAPPATRKLRRARKPATPASPGLAFLLAATRTDRS